MNYIKTEATRENQMYLLVQRDKDTGMVCRVIRTYYSPERAKQDLDLLARYGEGDLYEYFPVSLA